MVIDAAIQFGNGQVFPVGPLREGVTAGLKRAGDYFGWHPFSGFLAEMKTHKKPIFCAEMTPDITSLDLIQKYVAFAGIGHPEKFFESMRTKGVQIVDTRSFFRPPSLHGARY
ncbi:MAG: tetraacyldisaccharide 4'-kinase [Holosporaceae bacterium]|nr:MAG: tetraacyldisaccharide 4'-kinase [Holosporaceae bacterium]